MVGKKKRYDYDLPAYECCWLTGHLLKRYVIDRMTLWRWRQPKEKGGRGFPSPLKPTPGSVNRYLIAQVLAWELENGIVR
jgi:hypothetical protein